MSEEDHQPGAPGEPGRGDPKASSTVVVGVVGAVIVFVLVVALQALYYHAEEGERQTKVYSESPEDLSRLRAEQEIQINRYHWVDEKKGIVAIPIDEAMKKFVRDPDAPVTTAPASAPARGAG